MTESPGATAVPGPFDREVDEAFARVIRPRLEPGEQLDDALAKGYALAERRADVLHRPVTPVDAEFAFSLLCFWPIKAEPGPQAETLYRSLRAIVAPSGTTPAEAQAIPDQVLQLDYEELHRRQSDGSLMDLIEFPEQE